MSTDDRGSSPQADRVPPETLARKAGRVFTPSAPVREQGIFSGRLPQLRQVVDAINQVGQHAVIYGERGVGKTSLANIVSTKLQASGPLIICRVNCDASDDYSSVWQKVFSQLIADDEPVRVGFRAAPARPSEPGGEPLSGSFRPDGVMRIAQRLAQDGLLVFVIDEFDRLTDSTARAMFADTIKMLSDNAVPATIVLVGVADTLDQLIQEHESVQRAIAQVRMPRMSQAELQDVVRRGVRLLGLNVDPGVVSQIALLSQGLPHYTHALALAAVREAIDANGSLVSLDHMDAAVRKALESVQQSIGRAYYRATLSQRRDSLHKRVLLACALAPVDEFGYFAAADVRDPMGKIMEKPHSISSFSKHLTDFCSDGRGPVLQRTGNTRRYRYRFADPLMRPFVAMKAVADGLMSRDLLERFAPTEG